MINHSGEISEDIVLYCPKNPINAVDLILNSFIFHTFHIYDDYEDEIDDSFVKDLPFFSDPYPPPGTM